MPHIGPIKRRNLIYYLKRSGFEGPYPGGNHEYMVRKEDNATITIPNPHHGDIGEAFLLRIPKQAGIDKATWEKL